MCRFLASMMLLAVMAGCDNGEAEKAKQLQERVTQLTSEVARLTAELDEERNGAPRLLAISKSQLQAEDDGAARVSLESLIKRHPGSQQATEAALLLKQLNSKIAAKKAAEILAQERKNAETKAALAKLDHSLIKKVDEFKGITWVTHKSEPVLAKKMALYFGLKNDSAASHPLRLKFQYYSDDWLFVKSVSIKADDQTFDLGTVDFERDNSGGSIWEWSDDPINNFKMLDAVLSAKKVVIRFDGRQYYDDFILPDAQKAAMRDVLLAWGRYGGVRR